MAGTVKKPRLLDLFCGAGGCTKGYQRAGFYVVGVDLNPQPRYCGDEFIQADALEVLDLLCERNDDHESVEVQRGLDGVGDLISGTGVGVGRFDVQVNENGAGHDASSVGATDSPKPALRVKDFDAIHASPPCQDYSRALRHMAAPQPRLIEPVVEMLEATGLPWVVENVEGAPIPHQHTLDGQFGAMFCGTAFGKRVYRHRLFLASWPIQGRPCAHTRPAMNPHNQAGRDRIYDEFGRGDPEAPWRRELGVEWMGKYEGRESVPPYYTEDIGRQLLALERLAAA